MEHLLGVDLGGTNVKIGIVDEKGQIVKELHTPTANLKDSGDFIEKFLDLIEESLIGYSEIVKIGIGIPGMLSKDRTTPLIVPAIPELDNVNLKDALEKRFPGKSFFLENDANAAAIGEMHFSGEKLPEDFVFITLGTGVGGAAIIDNQIFKGGGNGMEIGHVLSWGGRRLEEIIGKHGMLKLALDEFKAWRGETTLDETRLKSSQLLIRAAESGDELALAVFKKVGQVLAESLVGVIRILDIKTLLIGGGLSACFDFISEEMIRVFNDSLPPYYSDHIELKRAKLGNQAGLVGIASLGLGN